MQTLTVALVQSEIQWLDQTSNFQKLDELLTDVTNVDLILLPETFSTGFAIDLDCAEPKNGPAWYWLAQKAKEKNAVIAGSVLVEQGKKKSNRFYWLWPNGRSEFYDKRHLFCLGNEGDHVLAGQARKIFEVNGFRILPQVCYDLRFPVFQRNRDDYDIMVNVANWPAARRNVWDTLLKARAMENVSYVLACNRVGNDGKGVGHSGGTAAFDFLGETLASVDDDKSGVAIVRLEKTALNEFKARFPAHLDADDFALHTV